MRAGLGRAARASRNRRGRKHRESSPVFKNASELPLATPVAGQTDERDSAKLGVFGRSGPRDGSGVHDSRLAKPRQLAGTSWRGRIQRGVRVCVATRLDAAPILAGEEERGMANFLEYNPEQAYLLPPTVREVLGERHLCFFVHGAVEKLDLQEFEAGYSEEGHPAYHPALLLKVWLYAYALGMTSSRRLEQRIREDLAFRYLAGGAQPDFWALNEFRKRHGRAMNDIFT